MENIFIKIFEYSPIVAILLCILYYFMKKIDKKDEKIHEMHKEFVELIKENHENMEKSCQKMIEKIEILTKK